MASSPIVQEINYAPRKWAKRLHASFLRWAVLCLHRRAGKTTGVLNHHQRAAIDDEWEMERLRFLLPHAQESFLRPLLRRRVYWHVMPTLKQAKQVAWDMLKDFASVVDDAKPNNSELEITYGNGNKVRLVGADDPDSLRGPALSGVSLDEYIDVSLETEAGPTLTALRKALEDDRKLVLAGAMTQAEFDQEWFLSPEAAIKGAIYGNEMAQARKDGRITRVPYDPALPVDTDWDLGIGDAMATWFSQSLKSGEVHLIDYHEAQGEGIPYYAAMLRRKEAEKRYVYGKHWGPHDIKVRELNTGKSRLETFREHGFKFEVTPRIMKDGGAGEVEEGINAARLLLARCWFDEVATEAGREALGHYRRDFNTRLDEFKPTPVHDWASHGADAFRGLAVRHVVPREERKLSPPTPSAGHWMGA